MEMLQKFPANYALLSTLTVVIVVVYFQLRGLYKNNFVYYMVRLFLPGNNIPETGKFLRYDKRKKIWEFCEHENCWKKLNDIQVEIVEEAISINIDIELTVR